MANNAVIIGLILVGLIVTLIATPFIVTIADLVEEARVIQRNTNAVNPSEDVYANQTVTSDGYTLVYLKFPVDIKSGESNLPGFNVTRATMCITNTTALEPGALTWTLTRNTNQTWTEAETLSSFMAINSTEGANVNKTVTVGAASQRCVDIHSIVDDDFGTNDNFSVKMELSHLILNTTLNNLETGNATLMFGEQSNTSQQATFGATEGDNPATLQVFYEYSSSGAVTSVNALLGVAFVILIIVVLFGLVGVGPINVRRE